MTFYDILMLVLFIGAVLHGYWKGLAWQVASVAAIVVSYIASVNFRGQLAPMLPIEEPWDRIAAMLILFLGCSLAIWVAYAYISKSMERMELKGFDSQAGALVGAVTGALLCMVSTMFSVSFIGNDANESIKASKLGPYIVTGIDRVNSIIPVEMQPYVHRYVEEWNQNKPQFEQTPDFGMMAGSEPTVPSYPSDSPQPGSPGSPINGGWGANQADQANYTTTNIDGTPNPGNVRPTSNWGAPPTETNQRRPVWKPIKITIDSEEILNGLEGILKGKN